jgi:hypothetical protein
VIRKVAHEPVTRTLEKYHITIILKSRENPEEWITDVINNYLQDPETGNKDEVISIVTSIINR